MVYVPASPHLGFQAVCLFEPVIVAGLWGLAAVEGTGDPLSSMVRSGSRSESLRALTAITAPRAVGTSFARGRLSLRSV